ncbi:MAG: RagB/SusD family nutrient uptake outer membrane protein [Lepagella sp.]
MKRKSLYIGAAFLAMAGLSSCSDSYLDVQPGSSISQNDLQEVTVAQTALNGLYECMNKQYTGLSLNQNVGESTVGVVVFDNFGNDYVTALWGLPGLYGWDELSNDRMYYNIIGWDYYYGLIGQANRIINAIPQTSETTDEEGFDTELASIKAQALGMRAHAYTRLMSLYANRWEESNNGERYCIVLRTDAVIGDAPLAKQNDVYKLIYDDCVEAITLFDRSGITERNKWEMNKNVVYGVLSRAALLKHDWQTALDSAEAAMDGYTVAQGDDLFLGYIEDSNDILWSMDPSSETTYYWSWGSHYTCNGAYVNLWGVGAGAINIDLYRQLDPNDVRCKFFFTPDKIEALPSVPFNPGKLKAEKFWDPNIVDVTDMLCMSGTNVYDRTGKDKNGYGMLNCVIGWCYKYLTEVYKGSQSILVNDDKFYNYIFLEKKEGAPTKTVRVDKTYYATACKVHFGAQCKFFSVPPYGSAQLPWMRASEMALTKAEALYMLGREGEAKTAFNDFQSKRVAGFSSKKSGDALLEEIKISRRAELWGEGHNFFDLKRWGERHERREWKANDPTSGNVCPGEKLTEEQMSPAYCNGWRLPIPQREFEYNRAIDLSLLDK